MGEVGVSLKSVMNKKNGFMSQRIVILNGANLNLLGVRQPDIYGRETLKDIENMCRKTAKAAGFELDFKQSNHEGDLIDWVQDARTQAAGLILNPAGFTHTSVALMDAVLACDMPVIEVHLSNIYQRESFRQHSYISAAARAVISGLGGLGYKLAVDAMVEIVNQERRKDV